MNFVPRIDFSEASPPVSSGPSAIELWQAELACEAHEGHGLDALRRILEAIKG
jgi:hypothetical protein